MSIPDRTLAVRWHGAHDVRLETVPLPAPGPSDVVLRVAYCGICGSDLHEVASGPHAVPVAAPHRVSGKCAPLVLGHEFSGTITGAISLDKVGMYGMSAGGHTALSLAGGRWSPSLLKAHCEAHIAEDRAGDLAGAVA